MRCDDDQNVRRHTDRVDEVLARLEGMNSREAAARYGFGPDALAIWRRRRSRGEVVKMIRTRNARAMERVLENEVVGPPGIPISVHVNIPTPLFRFVSAAVDVAQVRTRALKR